MKTMLNTLQQDILDELRWEPVIDSSRIGVALEQGVVVLTGHVRTLVERQAAERAVKRIYGVSDVANQLQVDLIPGHVRDDADIARAARDAMRWNVLVPEDRVQVTVTKGWVTLEGRVPHAYQRRAAEAAVEQLTGVKGVTNRIGLEPQASPVDLRRKLSAALHRYAQLEADGIQVQAERGRVTLTGTVRSWRERDLVQEAAWSAPGVSEVDNRLAVSWA